MIETYADRLAAAGLELQAIRLNTETPFLWASGYYMPVYNDNRMLLINSEYRRLIAEAFSEIIKKENIAFDCIAGTSTAGIPHATTLADMLKCPLTYVRDKPKKHGMKNRIEGLPAETGYNGKKVLLIEDLISTGGSSAEAVEGIREAGGDISCCLSIFSYGLTEALEKFKALTPPCRVYSILTYDGLLNAARKRNYISSTQESILREWKSGPFEWGVRHGFPPVKQPGTAKGGGS